MLKHFLAGLAALGTLAHAAPPVKDFFSPAEFKDAQLSPSGRFLAMRVEGDNQRDHLIVLDSETGAITGGARANDLDIGSVRWVNDHRLVYTLQDRTVAPGDKWWAPGMYAIDRDGKNGRQLVDHHRTRSSGKILTQPWNTFLTNEPGSQDSDFIHAQRITWDQNHRVVVRVDMVNLNTSNGEAREIPAPAVPNSWMLDHMGLLRIMVSLQDGQQTVYYRDSSWKWRPLAAFPAYGEGRGQIMPVGFMDDAHLLVKARINSDKAALHRLNLASGKIDTQPLLALGDFDFSGSLVYSNKRLVGIHYLGDARDTAWLDAGMKAAQAAVDKRLPGLINILTPPVAPEVPWLLVHTYSDRQPSTYSLYNSKTGELKLVGASHPAIKPGEMGRQTLVKIKARDGLELPVWLTVPAQGGKKLPMVVVVHGGPYVRGTEFGWNPVGQFLASRGYAVLEPEFRGSAGYGYGLFAAGMKQWGLAMQDDIADSVKWAVAQGHADPERVCLLGSSYGGYATLMGLIKDPELFRCGVAFAAVTDIPLMLEGMGSQSDVPEEFRKHGAPVLLGDLQADAERFSATSPLRQAARLKRPLLLAHGSDDKRVPLVHFTKMRSALTAHDANVQYMEYDGEAHGLSVTKNAVNFWSRVEKFLGKHIGASN